MDEAALDAQAVALVEVGGAEVAVGGAVAQQVVCGDQDGVADRHGGALGAPRAASRRRGRGVSGCCLG